MENTQNRVLYHHGILGMKWGVRRFQNEDGSLTKLGSRRIAEKKLRRAYNNALHAKAVAQTSKMSSEGADLRYKIAKKRYKDNKSKYNKKEMDKRYEHAEEMKNVRDMAFLNYSLRSNSFYKKADDYVSRFGSKKIGDLVKNPDFKMTDKKALAITYLAPLGTLKYSALEYASGYTAKKFYEISDFLY